MVIIEDDLYFYQRQMGTFSEGRTTPHFYDSKFTENLTVLQFFSLTCVWWFIDSHTIDIDHVISNFFTILLNQAQFLNHSQSRLSESICLFISRNRIAVHAVSYDFASFWELHFDDSSKRYTASLTSLSMSCTSMIHRFTQYRYWERNNFLFYNSHVLNIA